MRWAKPHSSHLLPTATSGLSTPLRSYLLMMFSCSGFSLAFADFFPFSTGGCMPGEGKRRVRAMGFDAHKTPKKAQGSSPEPKL